MAWQRRSPLSKLLYRMASGELWLRAAKLLKHGQAPGAAANLEGLVMHPAYVQGFLAKLAEHKKKHSKALSVAELLGGAVVGKKALPAALGKARLYHGTSNEAAKRILASGLDPTFGGGASGGAALLASSSLIPEELRTDVSHVVEASKGYVHLGGPVVASAHAELAETRDMASYIKGMLKGLAGLPSRGAVLPVYLPYRDVAPVNARRLSLPGMLRAMVDPDLKSRLGQINEALANAGSKYLVDPDLPMAIKTKVLIPPRQIGAAAILRDLKLLPESIKAGPGRFAAGLAGLGLGGGLMYAGGRRLLEKKRQ